MNNFTIIGSGAWGTALAQMLTQSKIIANLAETTISLICRDKNVANEINSIHTNSKYLGPHILSKQIAAHSNLDPLNSADFIILALPAQATRDFLKAIPNNLKKSIPVILTAKGFEENSLALQSQILHEEWENAIPVILSGPSFAIDVVQNKPTAVSLASADTQTLTKLAQLISSDSFRPYISNDPKGVQLCGGLKNVYALASGAIEGAELGLSSRSAFIARALAEMTQLVVALGGEASSVNGLAGIGDLALSCTSEQSRNYRFGIELGRGRKISQIYTSGLGLAEGVRTAPVALALSEKAHIDTPLIKATNHLLAGNIKIDKLVETLMTRPLKTEG